MSTEASTANKYLSMFEANMREVDQFQQIILTGHLIIEAALDNIIATIFFHPDHILTSNFNFDRKLRMARAYALRKDRNTIWNVISAINSVRNELAHNLAANRRQTKIDNLRTVYFAELTDEMKEDDKDAPDELIALNACALCTGFLGEFEQDSIALRRHIDALDAAMNPHEKRVRGPAG